MEPPEFEPFSPVSQISTDISPTQVLQLGALRLDPSERLATPIESLPRDLSDEIDRREGLIPPEFLALEESAVGAVGAVGAIPSAPISSAQAAAPLSPAAALRTFFELIRDRGRIPSAGAIELAWQGCAQELVAKGYTLREPRVVIAGRSNAVIQSCRKGD